MCSKIVQKERDIFGSILLWTSLSNNVLRQSDLSVLTDNINGLQAMSKKYVCAISE